MDRDHRSAAKIPVPSEEKQVFDGAAVFLASSAFMLRHEQGRWPAVPFSDIRDDQRAAA